MMLACSWSVSRIQRRSQVPSQVLSQVHSQGFPWRDRPPEKTMRKSTSNSHCYFTRLSLKKTGPLQFCLPALLGIHWHIWHPMQKEFLKSCEEFLRAALRVHGHPGPVWIIAKMALFNPCMKFDFFLCQISLFEVLRKCYLRVRTLSKICLRLRPSG